MIEAELSVMKLFVHVDVWDNLIDNEEKNDVWYIDNE